jgi:hypothetical protein
MGVVFRRRTQNNAARSNALRHAPRKEIALLWFSSGTGRARENEQRLFHGTNNLFLLRRKNLHPRTNLGAKNKLCTLWCFPDVQKEKTLLNNP